MSESVSAKLDVARSQLLLIDMQERLLPAMSHTDRIVARAAALLASAVELAVPATVSEQHPKGLGPTVETLRGLLPAEAPAHAKRTFSCMDDAEIARAVQQHAQAGRTQVVLAGVESHVCVMQTALDLREAGHRVYVAADAVGSRSDDEKTLALARMREEGIRIVSTEMVLFEWLRSADAPAFKAVSARIKAFS